ncbi:hypothetical protein B0H16DRAFT_1713144 [Mycena metata]|uniref:Uncharacterized protein n=1 Tax=Mycena metata TaxID=1033252 RepID=A0AAD7K0C5_9AGAR|nr:hypothetical protein B0H16DRAFT_1713144 [Mycena metata]
MPLLQKTLASFEYNLPDFVIGFAVADIILISLILGLCLWAAWNPMSRRHLNRVSFRLLIYALVANLACSGCIICAVKLGPGAACAGTVFFADACILFAAVMFFSMALNLQLVIMHGVNGQKMEKYYLSAAMIMTLACNIPPYAAGIYPLVSCFFLITTGALDLNSILTPEVNWRLNILDLLLYALRPMTYTLLAATDHSFLRALRALRGSETKASATPVQVTASTLTWSSSTTSFTTHPSTNCDTDVKLDSIEAEETDSEGSEESFTRQI